MPIRLWNYGGATWTPTPFDQWFASITELVRSQFQEPDLNACNLNFYANGSKYLDLHADDEALFPDASGKTMIISLSVGATREFIFAPSHSHEKSSVAVASGDVIIMCGNFQKYYKHGIAASSAKVAGFFIFFVS